MTQAQEKACQFNDGTVIAASPVVERSGDTPCRIVLRDLGDEYVTHMQSFDLDPKAAYPTSFFWGGCFQKKFPGALEKAWLNFEKKSRALLHINEFLTAKSPGSDPGDDTDNVGY